MLGKSLAIAVALAALAGSACAQHKVGGLAVDEVFADDRLARVADAACRGDQAGVAALINEGVNPNGQGYEQATPLFWAITCRNADGVRALLAGGADPNQIIKRFSAVHLAAGYVQNPEMLEALLSHGGDPDAVDDRGSTALNEAFIYAWETDLWTNWHLLLEAGADVNYADSGGGTIATRAAALARYDRVMDVMRYGYSYDLFFLRRVVELRVIDERRHDLLRGRREALRVIDAAIEQGPSAPVVP